MKFLCVPCDRPLTLVKAAPPEGGSLAIVYGCPDCGYEMAMLTNPHETQLISSLGVRIGPSNDASSATASEGAGRCPFGGMLEGLGAISRTVPDELPWTAEAQARLANVPEFVRPMARAGVERWARESGAQEVDVRVLEAARAAYGM